MKKLFAFLILLLIMPLSVNAHAGLSSSTPMEGEALDVSPEEIRFQFDSAIQQGAMTIVDESGSEIALSDVSPEEMELVGQLEDELPNGTYVVEWSVISQDGHEVAGTLTFNVAAETVEAEAAEETAEATETEEATAPPAEEEASQTVAAADEAAAETTPWMTIILIAVLAIAAVTIFVMARRR